MSRLILVLGDQLTPTLSALDAANRETDVVVMAEVRGEAESPKHHPQKIALIFAAMRKFAAQLIEDGWTVAYARLTDEGNAQTIDGELLRRADEFGAQEVICTTPGDWRLIELLDELPLKVTRLPDPRFILMDGDKPEGGKWNYDHDNRKPAEADLFQPKVPSFKPDGVTREVLELVADEFADHFGDLDGFAYPTTAKEAAKAADDFIASRLEGFGPYQDAMLTGEAHLYHSILSPALNIGLLDPLDLCRRAEAAYRDGKVPLNSAEGFIRQILGWREYVRGIYMMDGPGYTDRNALRHDRDQAQIEQLLLEKLTED